FRNTPVVPCTDCRYCVEGCPQKIRIPDVFKAYNSVLTFGDHNRPHWYYNGLVREGGGKAIDCISCGACESTCPQHIEIIETLKKASKVFD
ncbi:MAG: 4Fe-4S dicluster domain-containing protein, partial [Clostridia bacterium]|nr:4Fe-4S dicluster domain-containing protein [Clostridia bacterium]